MREKRQQWRRSACVESLDSQLSPRFVSAQVSLGRNHPGDRDDAIDDGAKEVGIYGHTAAVVTRGYIADDFGVGAQECGWDHTASRPPVRLFEEGSECRGDRGKVCLLRLEQCRCREPDGPRYDVARAKKRTVFCAVSWDAVEDSGPSLCCFGVVDWLV